MMKCFSLSFIKCMNCGSKQINFELKSVATFFNDQSVNEKNIGIAVDRFSRVIEIMKILIQQIQGSKR